MVQDAVEMMNKDLQETQYVCERLDQAGDVMQIDVTVEDRLRKAKMVIADLTEKNPNVYYEVGFARGLGRADIQIAEEGAELPADVRNFNTTFYQFNRPEVDATESMKEFAKVLKDRFKAVELSTRHSA